MLRIDYIAPICPCCGEECETLYRDRNGEYVGCDVCVDTQDAWEWRDDNKYA